ncbi:hypothetical protein N2152v2_005987 [Parachlorella kessleri]
MQGLRPSSFQQDENSLAHMHRGAAVGKAAFGGEGTLSLPGQRKALGNITNLAGGKDVGNGGPSKTPAAAGPRRALGDITNTTKVKVLQPRTGGAEKPAGLRPATTARPASRVDALAEGGVERLAGKTWQQQEVERLEREDAEISQRLLAWAALGKRSLPTYFPLWAPATTLGNLSLQREEQPALPPSPRMPAPSSGDLLAFGLDDYELPEVSFALTDDDILG